MKKDTLIYIALIGIILILGVSILIILNQPKILGYNPSIIEYPDEKTDPIEMEKNNQIYCPKDLSLYYRVDRKNTETLSDDTIYISLKNNEEKDYTARVLVNRNLENTLIIKGNTVTNTSSKTITDWWRKASSLTDSESVVSRITFSVELEIDGCKTTTSALLHAIPIVPISSGSAGTVKQTSTEKTAASIEVIQTATKLPD